MRRALLLLPVLLAACGLPTVAPNTQQMAAPSSARELIVLSSDRAGIELSRSIFVQQSVVVTISCTALCPTKLAASIAPMSLGNVTGPARVADAMDRVTFTVFLAPDTKNENGVLDITSPSAKPLSIPLTVVP